MEHDAGQDHGDDLSAGHDYGEHDGYVARDRVEDEELAHWQSETSLYLAVIRSQGGLGHGAQEVEESRPAAQGGEDHPVPAPQGFARHDVQNVLSH